MDHESYYITQDELALLLAGKGILQWYGFRQTPENGTEKPEAHVYELLAGLYQKGYVSWEDGFVKIEGAAGEMMDTLKEAVCGVRLQIPEEQDRILYLSARSAVLHEVSRTEAGGIRFTLMGHGEIRGLLTELEIFPENPGLPPEGEAAVPADPGEAYSGLTVLEPQTGEERARMQFYRDGCDVWVEWIRGTEKKWNLYTPEWWNTLLHRMVSGGEKP